MATEQVLETFELLSRIIEFASPTTQFSATLVCYNWKQHAIRYLWRELPSVFPLLFLLAPLERSDSLSPWEFSHEISYEDWERLQYYGTHVRSIEHDDRRFFQHKYSRVSDMVYIKLAAQGMNRSNFLPNIRSLQWTVSHPSSIFGVGLFTSPNLSNLDLRIHKEKFVLRLLKSLRDRIQNVKMLSIHAPHGPSVDGLDEVVAYLLKEMPQLSSVALPPFFLSQPIVAALETLSSLKTLRHSDSTVSKYNHNSHGCQLRFDSKALSGLNFVEFYMGLLNAINVFQSNFAPRKLETLRIGTREFISGFRLMLFLEAIAENCPSIKTLRLILYAHADVTDPGFITFEQLSPALKLDLTEFIIKHDNPLQYTEEDVITIGKAWPQMIYLSLNSEPLVHDTTQPPRGLPISSLSAFANHFPALQHLGVYLTVDAGFQTQERRETLASLQTLFVGTSVLSVIDAEEVAIFLADLIPHGKPDASKYSGLYPRLAHQDRRNARWDEAIIYFGMCSKAQQRIRRSLEEQKKKLDLLHDEKSRADRLQEEVIALRHEISQIQLQVDGPNLSRAVEDEGNSTGLL